MKTKKEESPTVSILVSVRDLAIHNLSSEEVEVYCKDVAKATPVVLKVLSELPRETMEAVMNSMVKLTVDRKSLLAEKFAN